jgi:hypothetical protein
VLPLSAQLSLGFPMDQLTLIVCSYHTPKVLLSMLQSYAAHHRPWLPQRLLIMENSQDDETARLLTSHNVPFQRNPGDTHSVSVDKALYLCKTTYALLVDSDVVFRKSVSALYDRFVDSKATLLGELVQSRGGYHLMDRISPWLSVIDVEEIQKRGIRYHDPQRIESSGSQGFFGNVPLQENRGGLYYDVGSTFLEDVVRAGLRILVLSEQTRTEYLEHYSGLSWWPRSGNPIHMLDAEVFMAQHRKDSEPYADIDVGRAFVNYV